MNVPVKKHPDADGLYVEVRLLSRVILQTTKVDRMTSKSTLAKRQVHELWCPVLCITFLSSKCGINTLLAL